MSGLDRRSFLALMAAGAAAGLAACGDTAQAPPTWDNPFRGVSTRAADGISLPSYHPPSPGARRDLEMDVAVFGGTPSGVAAALGAARLGASVVLVLEDDLVGGMMSGGLSATDVGFAQTIRGVADEVFSLIGTHYGTSGRRTYLFEPKVAERIMRAMLRQDGVVVLARQRIRELQREGTAITSVRFDSGSTVAAREWVDASYNGDLMAAAGARFTYGREGEDEYGETLAGVRYDSVERWGGSVDGLFGPPVVTTPEPPGSPSPVVQAFCFRLTVTDDPANRLPFAAPPNYDRADFAPVGEFVRSTGIDPLAFKVALPNRKYDLNSKGLLSVDLVGGSAEWPTSNLGTRKTLYDSHLAWQMGLLHYLSTDGDVPERIRANAASFGLARDEFVGTGGWTPSLYVRESRRLVGLHRLTQHDVQGRGRQREVVSRGNYPIDSHACRRVLVDGVVVNEGHVFENIEAPYSIPYGVMRPRADEVSNLLVTTCLSASHIAFGSVRTEPTLMMLGQAAGVAAATGALRGKQTAEVTFDEFSPLYFRQLSA